MHKTLYFDKKIQNSIAQDIVLKSFNELNIKYKGALGMECGAILYKWDEGIKSFKGGFEKVQILNNAVLLINPAGVAIGRLVKVDKSIKLKGPIRGSYRIISKCVAEDLIKTENGNIALQNIIKAQESEKRLKEEKHIIYTTEYRVDDYIEEWKAMSDEEREDLGINIENQSELEELACEYNREWLKDEQSNLPHQKLNMIVGIADIGRWDGRKTGYAEYSNISISELLVKMLSKDGETEIYVEGNELKATQRHHDGVNYIIYREVTNKKAWDVLKMKIYNQQEYSIKDLSKCTRSLYTEIAKIYGW